MRSFDIKRSVASALFALGILSSGLSVALPTTASAAPLDQWARNPASTVLYPVRFDVAGVRGGNVEWSTEYRQQRERCEASAQKRGYVRGQLHLTSDAYPASFPTVATANCLGYREHAIPE
jgi:hypothetical protein